MHSHKQDPMAQPFLIDIDRILSDKMGAKARYVPNFVVRYLKNIVHQDWLNEFIVQEGEKQGVQWLEDCIRHLDLHIEVVGKPSSAGITTSVCAIWPTTS